MQGDRIIERRLGQLKEVFEIARVKPAVVKVESHPYLPEWDLLDYCRRNGVVMQAFAALGHGIEPRLLDDPVITVIAKRVTKPPLKSYWPGPYSASRLLSPQLQASTTSRKIFLSRLFPMTRSRKLVKGSVHESGSIRLWTRASPGSFRGEDERPSHVAGIDAFSRSHRPFGVVERGSRIEAQLDRHLSCPDLGDMHRQRFASQWQTRSSRGAAHSSLQIDLMVPRWECSLAGVSRMASAISFSGRGGRCGLHRRSVLFQNTGSVDLRLESTTCSRSRWRQDEVSASVLFLSSRHMVAPRYEGLPGFDGVAYRAPLLRGRAPSSEIGFGLLH